MQDTLTQIYDKRSSKAERGLAMQSPKNKWRTSEASVDKKPRNLFQKQKIYKIQNHMYLDMQKSPDLSVMLALLDNWCG